MEGQIQKNFNSILTERMPVINKKIIFLCLLFAALSILLGMISFIPVQSDFLFLAAKACQLLFFFAEGLICIQLLNKYFSASDSISSKVFWIYPLLFTLFICAALFLLFLFTDKRMTLTALGASSAFLLPFIIKYSWYYYMKLLMAEQEIRNKKVIKEKVRLKEINEEKAILHEAKKKVAYENKLRQEQEEVERNQIYSRKQEEKRQLIKERQPRKNEVKLKNFENNQRYKMWFYKEPDEDKPPVILLNSVPLYIQLHANISEKDEELFNASAPLDMNLGDFFNHFINVTKKNNKLKIDFFNNKQMPVAWRFYTKSLIGLKKKELDPLLSLRRNKIKELGIIIARRFQV